MKTAVYLLGIIAIVTAVLVWAFVQTGCVAARSGGKQIEATGPVTVVDETSALKIMTEIQAELALVRNLNTKLEAKVAEMNFNKTVTNYADIWLPRIAILLTFVAFVYHKRDTNRVKKEAELASKEAYEEGRNKRLAEQKSEEIKAADIKAVFPTKD